MSSPYAPNESAEQIFSEKAWLQGDLLCNIVYGVEFTLFTITFYFLVRQGALQGYPRRILLTFITLVFILSTIFVACTAQFTQLAFIENRDIPGGPSNYEQVMFSIPVDETATTSGVIANWLMDALLVWRCAIIYRGCGSVVRWVIVLAPCVMLLASVTLGTLFLFQTSTSSPWAGSAVNFTLGYFSMSVALNIVATLLIAARLLFFRRQVLRSMGAGHVSQYTDVLAILVESASLFSTFAILFIVFFALDYPLAPVFLQTITPVQSIASLLIIFRVAQGKGWTEATTQRIAEGPQEKSSAGGLPSMRFASGGETLSSMLSDITDASFARGIFTTQGLKEPSQSTLCDQSTV